MASIRETLWPLAETYPCSPDQVITCRTKSSRAETRFRSPEHFAACRSIRFTGLVPCSCPSNSETGFYKSTKLEEIIMSMDMELRLRFFRFFTEVQPPELSMIKY